MISVANGHNRRQKAQRLMNCCASVLLTLPAVSVPSAAWAHRTASGWSYPPACCHGDIESGECQAIPDRSVQEKGGGWSVVLKPGDHRKVTHRNSYFVPYGSEIPSGDSDYHICLYPTEDHPNCFFVPPGAM